MRARYSVGSRGVVCLQIASKISAGLLAGWRPVHPPGIAVHEHLRRRDSKERYYLWDPWRWCLRIRTAVLVSLASGFELAEGSLRPVPAAMR